MGEKHVYYTAKCSLRIARLYNLLKNFFLYGNCSVRTFVFACVCMGVVCVCVCLLVCMTMVPCVSALVITLYFGRSAEKVKFLLFSMDILFLHRLLKEAYLICL